jgi:hypothetical protein
MNPDDSLDPSGEFGEVSRRQIMIMSLFLREDIYQNDDLSLGVVPPRNSALLSRVLPLV